MDGKGEGGGSAGAALEPSGERSRERAILCLVLYDTSDVTRNGRKVGDLQKVLKAHFQRSSWGGGIIPMEQGDYGLRERYDTGAAER